MVSMSFPSVNASPCHRKCDAGSAGALVTRDTTMNRRPASPRSFRFLAENIPASATITTSLWLCRAWNYLTVGMIVVVSALFPW